MSYIHVPYRIGAGRVMAQNHTSQASDAITFLFSPSAPATLTFLLSHADGKHDPPLRPLPLLFPVFCTIFPQIFTWFVGVD